MVKKTPFVQIPAKKERPDPKYRVPIVCLPAYPIEGTLAARVLDYIEENPHCSSNEIIKALDTNPSPTKKCLKQLVRRRVVDDNITPEGYHSYKAKKGSR